MTTRTRIHTIADLRQRQALPLEAKIQLSLLRIREWIDYWEEREVGTYVAFSGGKDSTVLLDLVRQVDPAVPAVFSDTGLEFPELKAFVAKFKNVEVVRPEMTFREVLLKEGYPVTIRRIAKMLRFFQNPTPANKISRDTHWTGYLRDGRKASREAFLSHKYRYLIDAPFKISEKCCDRMKHKPLHIYGMRTGRVAFVGLTTDESEQRATRWLNFGCNAYKTTSVAPTSAPLSIWTGQDVLEYIVRRNLPIASVYGQIVRRTDGRWTTTGERRTGCIFCGFALEQELEATNTHRFIRLRKTHPKLWEYCMKPVAEGGLGMREVLLYMGFETGE